MDTLFRISTDRFELTLEGREEYVRAQMRAFLPALSAATETAAPPPPAAPKEGLAGWYAQALPAGRTPTMQDAILVFGYYMKREREQHMFTPSDIKRAFGEVNRRVPKSLLQILGSLRRDHELLWSPEGRRGRYALTPAGIKHVGALLAPAEEAPKRPARKDPPPPPDLAEVEKAPALQEAGEGEIRSSSERWSLLFKAGEVRG